MKEHTVRDSATSLLSLGNRTLYGLPQTYRYILPIENVHIGWTVSLAGNTSKLPAVDHKQELFCWVMLKTVPFIFHMKPENLS